MAKKKTHTRRIVCINIATLLVLILITWLIFQWVSKRQEYPCNLKMLPDITAPAAWILCAAFGCALVAGIAGGSCGDVRCQLISYLAPAVFVVLSLLGSAAFLLDATRPAGPAVAPGGGDRRLEDYSGWLRRRVGNGERWYGITSRCLGPSSVCSELSQKYRIPQDFYNALPLFTPLQRGCCMPPKGCGYQYVNPTYWFNPNNTVASPDCLLWTNNQTGLCYYCSSCQAGFLANLTQEWSRLSHIFVIISVLLVLFCFFVCFEIRKNETIDGGENSGKGNNNGHK